MYRLAMGVLILLLFGPALQALDDAKDKPKVDAAKADKPQTPAEQYRAILSEFQKKQQEFSKAQREAKTQEERQKVFNEKYPKPAEYAGRMMNLAEKNPKDDAAVDALVWVFTFTRYGNDANKSAEILFRDHLDSKKLAQVCQTMAFSGVSSKEKYLRAALDKSPHHDVQGFACFGLASLLKDEAERDGSKKADAEKKKEAEELYERVVKQYADLKQYRATLGDSAKANLFEIRNLAIGKTAPDIEGEDSDGKKFKLSDYRGKVVVLDFWARW